VIAGKFAVAGTDAHDATYDIGRYDGDASDDDFLVVAGSTVAGVIPGLPGYYAHLGTFSLAEAESHSGAPESLLVNGVPIRFNDAYAVTP
jgi:hypothetical protein